MRGETAEAPHFTPTTRLFAEKPASRRGQTLFWEGLAARLRLQDITPGRSLIGPGPFDISLPLIGERMQPAGGHSKPNQSPRPCEIPMARHLEVAPASVSGASCETPPPFSDRACMHACMLTHTFQSPVVSRCVSHDNFNPIISTDVHSCLNAFLLVRVI